MRRVMPAAVVVLSFATPGFAQAPAPAPETTPAASAKVWIGRQAEFEEYLKTAPIVRMKDVGLGVTHPRRAFFAPGGLAASALVKNLPQAYRQGFWESYKSEIAAYELDKLLGLDMVPPTVQRRVDNDLCSVQLWVENCRMLKDVDEKGIPDREVWNRQVYRHRVFDNLVANIDENAGNILLDPAWNIILIDHSRSFFSDKMPFEKVMTHIDGPVFDKLKSLDEAALMARLKPWVMSGGTVRDILKRRDKIVAHFETLVRERGEAVILP